MRNEPRANRLAKRVISVLGRRKSVPLQQIKERLVGHYSNLPPDKVDSAVEAVLLALEERGWLQIEPGNRLSLTDVGLREYGSILATAELKKTRKAHRITAELNRQEITRRKAASKEVHDSLEVTLGELAFLLGRTWKKEHELARGRVITDVVWYGESRKMTNTFEVQHRGEWKNAIGNSRQSEDITQTVNYS